MIKKNVFTKIPQKESLVSDVVQQITEAIIHGHLKPGDKLVEERLTEQLGVSRAPIREALRQLEVLGLVDKRPYRGSFVSTIDKDEVVELHDLRVVLEDMAVRLCTTNLTEEIVTTLEEITAGMARVAEQGDRRQILVYDADFHDAMVYLSGNKLLADVWELVSARIRRFLYLKRHHTHERIEEVVTAHAAILGAICTRDPEKASVALQDHLSQVEDRFREEINKGDEIDMNFNPMNEKGV